MFPEDKINQAFIIGLIVWIVIILLLLSLLFLLLDSCSAETINIEKLADAIFLAEGGYKATYLYGIRSVKYENEEEARRICINSIKNNIKRWEKAGRPEDFITFMSRRYAPIGAKNDPNNLNKNWVKNVRYFYENK